MEFIQVKYGDKDVTDIFKTKYEHTKIVKASNENFGDPNWGVKKNMVVEYMINGLKKIDVIEENNYFIINPSNKLGIFYTNNRISYNILNESIRRIEIAAKKHDVTVLTCPWGRIPNNPFIEIISHHKNSTLFNINYQILQLLLTAEKINKFEYVSFLEHDVLYGEDYFDYPNFKENVMCNHNFIGINNNGLQGIEYFTKPLHQLTMKLDFAIKHFREILSHNITDVTSLEPYRETFKEHHSKQSSIHVNYGNNFTSHCDTYEQKTVNFDNYWDVNKLIETFFKKNL